MIAFPANLGCSQHTAANGLWAPQRHCNNGALTAIPILMVADSTMVTGRGVQRLISIRLFDETMIPPPRMREIGAFETFVQMRQYLADFDCEFHDVRGSPNSITATILIAIRKASLWLPICWLGSNGVVYQACSIIGGICIACFRPALVLNVRAAPILNTDGKAHQNRES